MADDEESQGGEARTRGTVGPIAGRAASVTPATARENVRPDGKAEGAEESGSPGAMEDEAQTTHRK